MTAEIRIAELPVSLICRIIADIPACHQLFPLKYGGIAQFHHEWIAFSSLERVEIKKITPDFYSFTNG